MAESKAQIELMIKQLTAQRAHWRKEGLKAKKDANTQYQKLCEGNAKATTAHIAAHEKRLKKLI